MPSVAASVVAVVVAVAIVVHKPDLPQYYLAFANLVEGLESNCYHSNLAFDHYGVFHFHLLRQLTHNQNLDRKYYPPALYWFDQ